MAFKTAFHHTYEDRRLASSWSYTKPPLWDLLSAAGLHSCVLGVPHTYPPRPFLGRMVTGLLTPPDVGVAAFPETIGPQAQALLGVSSLDVDNFRHTPLPELVAQVEAASRGLFRLATHWARRDDWSLLTLVDMGADRLQHALWRYAFAEHPRHLPGHPLQDALLHYYVLLDTLVGDLLDSLDATTLVMVVSDHGACAMHQAVGLNTWLIAHGYLVLHKPPQKTPSAAPRGCRLVTHARLGRWRLCWAQSISTKSIVNPAAWSPKRRPKNFCGPLPKVCARPSPPHPNPTGFCDHEISTPRCAAVPPICSSIWPICAGGPSHPWAGSTSWSPITTVVPDGANHDTDGIIIMGGAASSALGPRQSIYDVAPTVLAHLQVAIPQTMRGTPRHKLRRIQETR